MSATKAALGKHPNCAVANLPDTGSTAPGPGGMQEQEEYFHVLVLGENEPELPGALESWRQWVYSIGNVETLKC